MNSCLKYALREIALSQVASDAGKGIRTNLSPIGSRPTQRKRYVTKVMHQENAIKALSRMPRCGVNYYVERKEDQNGYPSILVYFDIAAGVIGNEERLQISFHNPVGRAESLANYVGKGRKCRWDKKSSRYTASEIARFLSDFA